MNIKKAHIDDDLGAVYWKEKNGEIRFTLIQDDGTIDFENHGSGECPESLLCHIRSTFG